MKFVIDGVDYPFDLSHAEERLTTWDIYQLETELADLKIDYVWEDFTALGKRVSENHRDPHRMLLQAWMIWTAKRVAGEPVTFRDAASIKSFDIVEEPKDKRPKTADRQSKENPTAARKAPGRTSKTKDRKAVRPASAQADAIHSGRQAQAGSASTTPQAVA